MSLRRSASSEVYRHRWSHFWLLATAGGVGLAMRTWSPPVVGLGLALDTACTAAAATVMLACLGTRRPHWSQNGHHRVIRGSFTAVSVIVGLSALMTVSPALAMLVLMAALLSSPSVAPRIGHRVPRHPGDRTFFHA